MRSFILFVGIVLSLHTQGQITYMRTVELPYPATIRGSAITPDGGLILCGSATAGGLLLRLDAQGNMLWSKTYAGIGPNDGGTFGATYENIAFNDIADGPDSSLVVVGSAGPAESLLGPGRLIAAFSATGDTLFAKGGGGVHSNGFGVIAPFGDGTYLIGGTYGTLNTSVASLGNFDLATHLFPEGVDHTTGEWASLSGAIVGLEGGTIGAGVSSGFIPSTGFVFKTDPSFGEQWHFRFSVDGSLTARAAKVAEAPDSTIYMATSFGYPGGGFEPFVLLRCSSDGALLWSKSIAMPTNIEVADVVMRGNGRVLIAGSAYQASVTDSAFAWLMQFRADGGLDWAHRYGALSDTVAVSSMEIAADSSGYYMFGSSGAGRVMVLRVDTLGMLSSCSFPSIAPGVSPAVLTPEPVLNATNGGGGPASRFAPLGNVQYGLDQFTCAGSASHLHASGTVYHDTDQDGTFDPGESGSPWAMLAVSPNTGWLFGNSEGDYLLAADASGTYTLTTTPLAPWWALSSDSLSYHPTFTATDTLFEDLDFGYT
ncbi:MAG: hypothetical protein ABI432_10270, partial [Flavobacteriales bacterium]